MMNVLNFHGLGPLTREIDRGEYSCWLEVPHFETILDHVRGNEGIVITFDDGNVSDFEIALPALLQRGMRAVFFICSGRIGEPGFLSAAQVRELDLNGMSIGSHGVDHRPWRTLKRAELEREVKVSRSTLEEICRKPVDMAACPFGSYDRRVLGILKEAGYRTVFTSDGGGCAEKQWLRTRTTIKRDFTTAGIDRMLQDPPSMAWRLRREARLFWKRNRLRPLKRLAPSAPVVI
jgi:peptidoglycan/xylan/chitin deacetylase (PgdA/CDA1 family)